MSIDQKMGLGVIAIIAIIVGLFFNSNKAEAAVDFVEVKDQSVFVGDSVSVDVVVNRTKTGLGDLLNTTNDWQSTEIGGECFDAPNLILGTGLATTTYQLSVSSTAVATTTDIEVKVFHLNGCDDNGFLPGKPYEDKTSFELKVKEVPAPSSPSNSSEKKSSSGGSHMSPAYYGFTSAADQERWKNYDERQKMLGEWRYRMCQQYGAFCGK